MDKFKFKLKKRKGKKFLDFDLSQIAEYSPGAQLDFFHCFKKQIEYYNGEVLEEWSLQEEFSKLVAQYNSQKLSPKTLDKIFLERALINFFIHPVNAHLIDDWKVALELFETIYE
jgi:hypothetical protein